MDGRTVGLTLQHIADESVAIDREVECLANALVFEDGMRCEHSIDLRREGRDAMQLKVRVLGSQRALLGNDVAVRRARNAIRFLELSFPELVQLALIALDERQNDRVEERKLVAVLVAAPVIRIALEAKLHVLLLALEYERTRANRMSEEIRAVLLDGFARVDVVVAERRIVLERA